MSTTAQRTRPVARPLTKVFNLPNQLTSLRLLLSVVLFGLIAWEHYISSFVLFLIAAGTDWLDGYYARKYSQVTTLGRILDPFADKVIICGTFIFLVVAPGMIAGPWWGLRAWMVVVIVGREILVTALRSFIEERGADFSANMSGKLKMVLQCVAAGSCLVYLHYPPASPAAAIPAAPEWVWWFTVTSVWLAVALTVYSGVVYVFVAVKLLHQES
jgi:CDP-diacylglycerol--glycerol-3-phosphate 3-phosphatidyltransferase